MDQSLEVSVAEQQILLIENNEVVVAYPVSTAKNGVGCEEGSNCTPTGRFEISDRIGADASFGTIFKGRLQVGQWTEEQVTEEDLVLTRILWLHGLDPENANTKERYIYIHGTNHEILIGQPVSHGCVRMRNDDIIALFDRVNKGTPVRIV